MTFPWKKAKSGRFSQLVSDQIRERRRKSAGSPMVVETGFPASIVDLLVKNKDRLRRPSSKKQNKNNRDKNNNNNDNHDFISSSPSPSLPSPPPPSLAPSTWHPPSPAVSPLHHRAKGGGARGENDGGVVENYNGGVGLDGNGGGGGGEESVNGNRVLVAILRISLVVVLALGTKKFVVGITVSAFMLLLLEYVGKYIFRASGPPIEPKERIRLLVKMVMGAFRIKKIYPEGQNGASRPTMRLEEVPETSCPQLKNQEHGMICNAVQESEITQNEENESEKERIDDGGLNSKKDVVVEGVENGGENGELQRRKSRKARMKLKMKGLVPKRLIKKKAKDFGVEACPDAADNVAAIEEEKEDQSSDRRGWGCASDLSSMTSVTDDGKLGSSSGSDESMESSINLKEATRLGQNSGYVALVLIVLVGLVGGRVLALMLTVAWCLVLKSGQSLRKYIKVPFLRPPPMQCS